MTLHDVLHDHDETKSDNDVTPWYLQLLVHVDQSECFQVFSHRKYFEISFKNCSKVKKVQISGK